MDHSPAVGVVEAGRNRPQHIKDVFLLGARLRGQQMVQGRTIDELHGDIGDVVLLAHLVDGDDGRMGEHPGRTRLPVEPFAVGGPLFGIDDVLQANDFEGHGALNDRVHGAIDDTHSTAPDFRLDLIGSQSLHTGLAGL